jgi:hypothetical protein
MKETLVQQCLTMLQRDDIKNEMRSIFSPILGFIFDEISTYIYAMIGSILILFIMVLAILIILISLARTKTVIREIF